MADGVREEGQYSDPLSLALRSLRSSQKPKNYSLEYLLVLLAEKQNLGDEISRIPLTPPCRRDTPLPQVQPPSTWHRHKPLYFKLQSSIADFRSKLRTIAPDAIQQELESFLQALTKLSDSVSPRQTDGDLSRTLQKHCDTLHIKLQNIRPGDLPEAVQNFKQIATSLTSSAVTRPSSNTNCQITIQTSLYRLSVELQIMIWKAYMEGIEPRIFHLQVQRESTDRNNGFLAVSELAHNFGGSFLRVSCTRTNIPAILHICKLSRVVGEAVYHKFSPTGPFFDFERDKLLFDQSTLQALNNHFSFKLRNQLQVERVKHIAVFSRAYNQISWCNPKGLQHFKAIESITYLYFYKLSMEQGTRLEEALEERLNMEKKPKIHIEPGKELGLDFKEMEEQF
ncbi:hypothetical protein G7Y89_g2729 [Cudoniella acicularis]|uniref:2EXR domain-containing protein n=1 Tax=Cudoniella acicularis TaxID=354080 RepID=A0A8H4RTY7_9HELO|nr:hypothetical protein G7Y89_g2729 [Cudoniella acicularis]